MLNNQLTLQRLIGKVDNDFNISESDWIPRVAAWTIDALSQMKVLPMERKRRTLEVSDRIAQFPCTINAEELSVYDSNGCEIPAYKKSKSCSCNTSNIPFTGEQIGITNPYAPNGWETVQVANVVTAGNRNFVLDGNNIILNFDITEDNMDDILNYYLQWKYPEGYVKCTECGVWVKKGKTNTPKYCKKCAKKINLNKTNARYIKNS